MTDSAPWTIGRLLSWTTDHFAKVESDSARLDAEVLLAHSLGRERIMLYAAFDEVPPANIRDKFKALVKRRGEGEPVAYLVGSREFYSLPFEVTPDVLIPRPETELIVVALTDRVKARPAADARLKIADIGTGSGVLAVCAAKYVPNADILATDVSPAALAVAKRNAQRHKVDDRVYFVEADLLPANKPDMRLDYIVSNPPYITSEEMTELDKDVRDFEPHLALDGGPQGTDVIERLLPAAAHHLKPGGSLLMEISPMIAPRVEQLIDQTPGLERRPTIRDLAGHARVVEAARSND
ncbi:Release factor glutamine methyltransferase [Posidoniimonas corsicana]|uniref:Release factor glutamine methyltransferase n=1 Tax=Posidoniimonas corsicana TaxID=1938618 RepID=A0A5C5VEK3_9BACT|nr:peptide chain release factor N(5)-glutamine methyltransferase [Posidoniimonas corsicana]TWT36125.1 Release factor glutamine methyltransferase [Posidoniimonas corsicana]